MSGLKYRKAIPDDAERIFCIVQQIIEDIYTQYYSRPAVDFLGRLHSIENIKTDIDRGMVYVLEINGKIIGTGSRANNHITSVYVLPEYQGHGFGSLIMDKLEKEIFSCFDECELDTLLSDRFFYVDRDYITVKRIKYDIGDGKFINYEIMKKQRKKWMTII